MGDLKNEIKMYMLYQNFILRDIKDVPIDEINLNSLGL